MATAARLMALLLLTASVRAQNDRSGNFPVKASLPISGASGAVAGLATTVYTSSLQGEIYLSDIKSANGTLLNRGGDGQTLGGLCLDSRNDMTLYGAGRGSGLLYAFTARGKLVRRFVISEPSTAKSPHYISHCVQSRYYLIVVDAFQNKLFKLDLADTGPGRGNPPALRDDEAMDATEVDLGGDWEPAAKGELGPIAVEWSRLWNETGFVLNQDTGKVYLFPLSATGEAKLERMSIRGKQKTFPGSTHMLFDSRNERILYLVQPTRNAVAVIEINEEDPTKAMYIRTLTSPLLNGPVASAEFGEFLYLLNSDLGAEDREDGKYSLVQLPKHNQELPEDHDEDEPFTPVGEGDDPPQNPQFDAETLKDVVTADSKSVGLNMVAPLDEDVAPKDRATATPGSEDAEDEDEDEEEKVSVQPTTLPGVFSGDFQDADDGGSCFPADATVEVRGGGRRRMKDVQIGDEVLVAPGEYSRVFMFTHKLSSIESEFVRLSHSEAGSLILSPGHYLYANGVLTSASSITVGDVVSIARSSPSFDSLSSTTTSAQVVRVDRVRSTGLFNPQTVRGDIVVNGVVASTYTTAVEPAFAHAALAPLRLLERLGFAVTSLETGGGVFTQLMPRGKSTPADF